MATAWIARLLLVAAIACGTVQWGFAAPLDAGSVAAEQAISGNPPQLVALPSGQAAIHAEQKAKPHSAGDTVAGSLTPAGGLLPPQAWRMREEPVRAPPHVSLPAPRPETRAPPYPI